MQGKVVSINVSDKKGVPKSPVKKAALLKGHGIQGDAHSGGWHRQVSLLALESIKKMQRRGLEVKPGDFAENITTEDIDLLGLPVGTKIALGAAIEAEVTQIGKVCHTRCAIFEQAGDCVMPREGIFVRVLRGGNLKPGDIVRAL